ncbi:hypothetical protein [Novosphingobium lentum]|uniref:hypothetical protein n=1 Tax=Novosphingobium lentum TaxID=145287 RepID=UPI0008369CCF|nr:hypothetical protein [Novosphingobium lentum]
MHSRQHVTPWGWQAGSLPWLRAPAIGLLVLLVCLPFVLVEVPPLIDIPGHMGAAAIEQADPGSPLQQYFGWRWMFTLNLGGEVLMKLLAAPLGLLAAGWWSAVLATALFAGGCLATVRVLNPRGGHAAAWALMFVFSFPLLTGFLNYILAVGLSLSAFAASIYLENQPRKRAAMLIVLQPVALLCHAIGGVLLPLLIGMYALGKVIEEHPVDWREVPRRPALLEPMARALLRLCWPLGMGLVTILVWKFVVPGHGGFLRWRWDQKAWSFALTLRDQWQLLDIATSAACGGLIVFARLMGARWSPRQALPPLAVFVLFVAIPSDINGSAFVDIRLLPVAAMLALGLQDWSRAPGDRARFIAVSGAALLAIRLLVTAGSFADYAQDYNKQLSALHHVEPGSRVLAFVEHSCIEESWRNTRRDHLASMASIYRQAWVNDNWAVPGLDMVVPRFRPGPNFAADPSEFVWSPACQGGRLRSVDTALRHAPIDLVDYVWLIDTGLPHSPDPRLRIVWQDGRSILFAVKPLGFAGWRLSQL